jgi:carbonic anhydrase
MQVPADLLNGYGKFRRERYRAEAERYRELARGQAPQTAIVACADSRVDPASIFSAAPGELFVVRNVAALVPPCEEGGTYHGTSAAIEFAVTELKVANVVVMGHGMCGGIAAALAAVEDRPLGRFVRPWVELLAQVRAELLERGEPADMASRQKALERLAVQQSLTNLTSFPFVNAAVAEGRLVLHGAWFSIAEGELHWLEPGTGAFRAISA